MNVMTIALVTVNDTLTAIASIMGEPVALRAIAKGRMQIVLVGIDDPRRVLKVLGTPRQACAAAHAAFLRAGVEAHGHPGA